MYSGSPIESAVWWDGFSFPSASFQGPEHNAFDLDSRFLVALRPVPDLLLLAKDLFIAARTLLHGLESSTGLAITSGGCHLPTLYAAAHSARLRTISTAVLTASSRLSV